MSFYVYICMRLKKKYVKILKRKSMRQIDDQIRYNFDIIENIPPEIRQLNSWWVSYRKAERNVYLFTKQRLGQRTWQTRTCLLSCHVLLRCWQNQGQQIKLRRYQRYGQTRHWMVIDDVFQRGYRRLLRWKWAGFCWKVHLLNYPLQREKRGGRDVILKRHLQNIPQNDLLLISSIN